MALDTNSKTVAFLTSNVTSMLSREIWSGIQYRCNELNYNSLCVTGELLFPEGYETNQGCANIAYSLIDKKSVDAIILYAADVGELVEDSALIELVRRYSGIPIVSIARPVRGISTISIQNYSGMYSLVDHLITQHGCTEIAFVKGPDNNPEAEERFTAYCNALRDHSIGFDKNLVLQGEFSRYSGHYAVEQLWNGERIPADAIVCVDDETAFGVIEALQSHGVDVPGDIVVTGFDNTPESMVLPAPLTTVAQPLKEQGKLAVDSIVSLFNGVVIPSLVEIPTTLKVRKSCGCSPSVDTMDPEAVPAVAKDNWELLRSDLQNAVSPLLVELFVDGDAIASELVTALVNDCSDGSVGTFSEVCWDVAAKFHKRGSFLTPFHTILSKIESVIGSGTTVEGYKKAHRILSQGRVQVCLAAEQFNSYEKITAEDRLIDLGDINYALNALFSRESAGKLFSSISDNNFEKLHIRSFFLVLYADNEVPLDRSKLLFAWQSGISKEVYNDDLEFPTMDLLPSKYYHLLSEEHFVISPLYFGDEQYGYFLTGIDAEYSMVCDILSWQVSSAFKRVDLIRQEERRSIELEQSLKDLREAQSRLVESEKMASLGNLVAGVAHEINTPIGAGVTYASFFKELVDTLETNYNSGQITKSGLQDFIAKGKEISQGLLLNLDRAADLIRSFKSIAVDQTYEELRRFNLSSYLDEILLSLKNVLKRNKIEPLIHCNAQIELTGYPGALSQVISNLIMNSVTHAFDDVKNKRIAISAVQNGDVITLIYIDNGCGIPLDIVEHIFDPFFTTKRESGGSGLGMNIVYNIVTQTLGGSIECESNPGKGVTFTVSLPVELHTK